MSSIPNDIDLMARISHRDQQALSELYQSYGSAVYGLALRVLRNEGLAEEVTQDTFLKLWHQPERWDADKGKLIVWLLTITRHAAIDRLRREQRAPEVAGVPVEDLAGVLGNPSLVDEPDWQNNRLMMSLMQQLPSEQSQVVEMAFYQGYTHSDIAERLSLPLGTVKTRLRLGLQKLKSLWLVATRDEDRKSAI
jgi:RNA polymerase sigma-70 factor (ECF subfamily)